MRKLLIIEDNWMNAQMVEDVANLVGIEVIGKASSWNECSKILDNTKPDFAVVDINLEGPVDGIEVARRLKAKDIAFMFLTAYKDLDTIKDATELTPLTYLIKPVTPENLMASFLITIKKSGGFADTKPSHGYTIKSDMIYKDGKLIELSKSQRRILALLIKNLGHVVGYETLLYNLDGSDEGNSEASLRNMIAKLRKKCPDLNIKNIKDMGYIANILD